MSENQEFKWKRMQGEQPPDLYANVMHLMWTLDDVTVKVGQLVSDPEETAFVARELGSVTMSWRGAKQLLRNLSVLIESQEKTNGEINLDLKIAPTPE